MEEPLVGQIELFAFGFAPYGWTLCNGGLLNITGYQALYSLLGVKFGGDGRTTFAVPNLLGTEPIPNTNFYISLQGYYPVRN